MLKRSYEAQDLSCEMSGRGEGLSHDEHGVEQRSRVGYKENQCVRASTMKRMENLHVRMHASINIDVD